MYLHRIGAICAPSKNLLTESYYQFFQHIHHGFQGFLRNEFITAVEKIAASRKVRTRQSFMAETRPVRTAADRLHDGFYPAGFKSMTSFIDKFHMIFDDGTHIGIGVTDGDRHDTASPFSFSFLPISSTFLFWAANFSASCSRRRYFISQCSQLPSMEDRW